MNDKADKKAARKAKREARLEKAQAQLAAHKEQQNEAKRNKTHKGFGVTVKGDTISKGTETYSIEGVTATVDSVGGTDRRISATRVVGGAVLGGGVGALVGGVAKKKNINRQLFLNIEGPEFYWTVEVKLEKKGVGAETVNKDKEAKARKFAAEINQAARQRT